MNVFYLPIFLNFAKTYIYKLLSYKLNFRMSSTFET